jgi:hypothetical protein
LGAQQQAALVHPIGDQPAVRAEHQDRQELSRHYQAERCA